LRDAGVAFEALIVGEGELRDEIEKELKKRALNNNVFLKGRLSQEDTMKELAWADVLLHTGVIDRNGDRDGLPNVIPEAMAAGVLVVASPVSGVVEAIKDNITGILRDVNEPVSWVLECQRIQKDDALCERIRSEGRAWVERESVASRNSAKLLQAMRERLSLLDKA
jgi:glycosyltransferase involved in cell wall biosynthesis